MKTRTKRLIKFASVTSLVFSMLLGGMVASNSKQATTQVNAGNLPANYYSSITDSMSGTTLLNALNDIIDTSSVSVSYDWSRYKAADEDPNNSNNILTVYARTSMAKSNCGGGEKNWNREHSFPQSKISVDKAKSDNHLIFASDNKVNNKRGNYRIGDLTGYSPNVNDCNGKATNCIFSQKGGENFFDPNNVARGIVARSTFYAAVMYGFDIKDNFETIELALKWNLEYAPNSNDIRRNDTVYNNQHNRNPFVDHPEYACRIWGNTNDRTKAVCGGQDIPKTLQTITLDKEPTKKVYYVGEIFDPTGAKVTAYYSDGTSKDVTNLMSWPTTPLIKGQYYVECSYSEGGVTRIINITNLTVNEKGADYVDVTGVTLNKDSLKMNVGDTVSLTPTVAPVNATNKSVVWSSSNPNVATVDTNGKVTAVGEGKAEITANASGKTAKCSVIVKAGGSSGEDKPNKSSTTVVIGFGKYQITLSGTEAILISIAIVAVIGGVVFAAIFVPLKVLKKRKNK